jgi:hypothetical protein
MPVVVDDDDDDDEDDDGDATVANAVTMVTGKG